MVNHPIHGLPTTVLLLQRESEPMIHRTRKAKPFQSHLSEQTPPARKRDRSSIPLHPSRIQPSKFRPRPLRSLRPDTPGMKRSTPGLRITPRSLLREYVRTTPLIRKKRPRIRPMPKRRRRPVRKKEKGYTPLYSPVTPSRSRRRRSPSIRQATHLKNTKPFLPPARKREILLTGNARYVISTSSIPKERQRSQRIPGSFLPQATPGLILPGSGPMIS